jgi:hypothetical protein
MQRATVVLPYDIHLKKITDSSVLESRLRLELVNDEVPFDVAGEAATHAIEALLLALFDVGFELADPRVATALETAATSVADYLMTNGE